MKENNIDIVVKQILNMIETNYEYGADAIGEKFEDWCENGNTYYFMEDLSDKDKKQCEAIMRRISPYIDELTTQLYKLYEEISDEEYEKDLKRERINEYRELENFINSYSGSFEDFDNVMKGYNHWFNEYFDLKHKHIIVTIFNINGKPSLDRKSSIEIYDNSGELMERTTIDELYKEV